MILFDQFSRHVYRGTPESFSFDKYGIELARYLLINKYKLQIIRIYKYE